MAPRFRPGGIRHDLLALDRAEAYVLLHDDGVVPIRHDGTRENTSSGALPGLAGQCMTGRGAAFDGELASRLCVIVSGGEGEPVYSRVGVRRHRSRRQGRRCQDAAGRFGQLDLLDSDDGPHSLLQDCQRFRVAQPGLVVRKAVVEQLVMGGIHGPRI